MYRRLNEIGLLGEEVYWLMTLLEHYMLSIEPMGAKEV
jgi:hypothetical protein